MPVEMKNSFGTAKANMKNAIVRVVEGESTVPGECTPLGICDIELPPFLPKGSPVELTYTYNENQVLEVIVDAYGRQNRVQIARNTGLSESEIETATADLAADQGGLATASPFLPDAWRCRIRFPIIRSAGTAGRTYNSDDLYERLCLTSTRIRARSRSRITAGSCSSGGRRSSR